MIAQLGAAIGVTDSREQVLYLPLNGLLGRVHLLNAVDGCTSGAPANGREYLGYFSVDSEGREVDLYLIVFLSFAFAIGSRVRKGLGLQSLLFVDQRSMTALLAWASAPTHRDLELGLVPLLERMEKFLEDMESTDLPEAAKY
eukprot:CAMPEP_0180565354 /NCGR_PEP_ID=MMETSP1037_2-20121125/5500_1 /TAXON_ID=632150 /ORGANISM="Azadinium spinosum, Strain 3D9" /LENGTH=142 /DNA_ID=CAMNT_0022582317 /DNA_START=250 /DNA_END=679 /DNA_ORIENTATION=-